jgi:positive regulator of sigma E activity
MLEQSATVSRCSDKQISLRLLPQSGCHSCANRGCSTSALADLLPSQAVQIELQSAEQAEPGQQVTLILSERGLLLAALLGYLLPLLTMLVAVLVVQANGSDSVAQVVAAAGGLWAGLRLARWMSANSWVVQHLQMRIKQ